MKLLLEDGLGLIDLELGLEVLKVMVDAEAIGTTTKVVPVDVLVGNFLTRATPVYKAVVVSSGHLVRESHNMPFLKPSKKFM